MPWVRSSPATAFSLLNRRCPCPSSSCLGLLALVLLSATSAQAQFVDVERPSQVEVINPVLQMRNSAATAPPVNDPNSIDKMRQVARWLVYTMTKPEYYQPGARISKRTTSLTNYGDILNEAKKYLIQPDNRSRLTGSKLAYIREFGKQMVTFLKSKEILNHPEPLVRVNGMRMLGLVARSGYAGVAEVAIDILKDANQTESMRFLALRALKNLLAVPNVELPEKSLLEVDNRQLYQDVVRTLIAFLHRPMGEGGASDDPVAYRYLRREAVRALAEVPTDLVLDPNRQVVARPGFELLRVANVDRSLSPPPDVTEQVAAVIGYCRMIPDKRNPNEIVNLDYAAYFVNTAVFDLVGKRLVLPSARIVPWKVEMARLEQALNQWQANTQKKAIAKANLVGTLVNQLLPNVVRPIKQGGRTAQLDSQQVEVLRSWEREQRPSSASMYPNAADTQLQPNYTAAKS